MPRASSIDLGVRDLADIEDDQLARYMAFATAFRELHNRISVFVSLPFDTLNTPRLKARLDEIGLGKAASLEETAV